MSQIDRIPQLLAAILTIALLLGREANATEKWGPFLGQVVDVETGQPIERAVVLAVWWEIIPSPIHTTEKFYEAKEAVTGPDGRFEIPRLSVPPWALGVQPGQVTLFAPGYKWEATAVTPPNGERFVDPTIIQMRRLKTREERLKNVGGRLPAGVPHEKMAEFIKAIDKERAALGLSTNR